MSRQQVTPWVLVAALGVAFSSLHSPLATADDAATGTFVEQALACEAAGRLDERRRLLDEALVRDPEDRLARWLSGHVQADGGWVRFDEAMQQSADLLEDYAQRRGAAPQTAEGHLQLANWCRSVGLADRERAHLTEALADPVYAHDPDLRKRAGFEQIDGQWISRFDAEEGRGRARRQAAAFERWLPRLQRIAQGLRHASPNARDRALREWQAIDDPDSLPAMEAVFSHGELALAHQYLEVLAGMPSHRAATALARQALYSPLITVREAAAKKLCSRPPEQYASLLIDALSGVIEDESLELFIDGRGARITRKLTREGERQVETFVLESNLEFVYMPAPGGEPLGSGIRYRQRAAELFATWQALKTRPLYRGIELDNLRIEDVNARATTALALATGIDLPSEPGPWWRWWADFNQIERNCVQRTVYFCSRDQIAVPTPMSCLAAGTRVWTDRGAIPVETVQIGDLALSRHPETAELAYKPVLRTTVRPATELHKVTVGGDSFLATGGHTFWISGRGWTKVRDLEPGLRFHGATEPSVIEAIEPGGSEPTYNLIVADFHTYFVGPRLVLSHDPTFAQPTDVKVPGLAAR
jgi:hypothetical protein